MGLVVFTGLSVVVLDFGTGSPVATVIPDPGWRLLLTGVLFAATGSLFALTPPGRLSGAHLNPALTFGFWLTGHVRSVDLLGYSAAQTAGAATGAALVRLAWGDRAASVHYGQTLLAPGLPPWTAVLIEALMTALLMGMIFFCTSKRSITRWTPLAVWALVAVLVWRGAPYTGTSLNPARSFGPDLVSGSFANFWVYVAGPLIGAATAAAAVRAFPQFHPLTAKLFHDSSYRSPFRSALETQPP